MRHDLLHQQGGLAPAGNGRQVSGKTIPSLQQYALLRTINPVNSEVYIADAIDYVQNGVVLRYSPDGELLDEFYVGIIPGAFCWR